LARAKLSNAFALQMGDMKVPIRFGDITQEPSPYSQLAAGINGGNMSD
jgi:hypothetical protein